MSRRSSGNNYQRGGSMDQPHNYGRRNDYGNDNGRINRDPFYNFDMCAAMDDFDDPFDHMFGGGFGGGFRMPNIFQEAERMMSHFNDQMRMIGDDQNPNQRGGQLMARGSNPGTFITKSYVSRVNYNNGQPEKEVYQSQSINQFGQDGHKIQEKQEAYKNSRTGVEKASHQRVLDDRGQKCIRQRNRNTGEQNEHNIYKGFEENDLESFNRDYNDYRQKSNFQENYKALNSINSRFNNMIGDGRRQRGSNPALPSGNNYQQRRANQPQPLGLPSGNSNEFITNSRRQSNQYKH